MHLSTKLLLLALLCLTVVPGQMSLVVKAHKHHHAEHPHRSPRAKSKSLTLPVCARPAFTTEALTVGCKHHTAHCVCHKPGFFRGLMAAITNSCSAADQAAVQASIEQFCGADLVVPVTTHTSITTKKPVTKTSIATVPRTTVTRTRSGHTVSTHRMTTKTTSTMTRQATHHTTTSLTHKTSASTTTHATNGKPALGDAGRVQAGLGVAALAAVIVAMGWIFDEF